MVRILAVCNAKGGTGKTTVATNLSACLALQHGKRVLGIDLDAQGDFGIGLGVDPQQLEYTAFHLLINERPDFRKYIHEIYPTLHVIPNAIDSDLENKIDAADSRESLLKRRLKFIQNDYDFIIIDTPPAMRVPTKNAILAADEVLIVLDCGYYALYGITDLLRQMQRTVQASEKEGLVIRAILNLFNKGQKLDNDVRLQVEKKFENLMCSTVIHKNVRLAEAASAHEPILSFDRAASGSFDFLKLTKELLETYEQEEARTARLVR